MPEAVVVRRVDDGGAEEIARVYLRRSGGDAQAALRAVISDALADLDHADRRLNEHIRLVSRGYTRGMTRAVAG